MGRALVWVLRPASLSLPPTAAPLPPGQSITVSWTSTNLGGNASLELVSCTGTSTIALIADNTSASGSRSYTLPSNLAAGQYRIKAYRTGTGTPVAYGTCFSVGAAPSISVTAPNSGTFTPGQSITVSWTSTNLGGNASLELVSCTGTSTIALIADNTSASGSRSYTLPSNLAAGQYRIKAYRTGTGTPVAYGTCFSVGAAASISVTAPLSGTFTPGQSITVSWTSTNLGGNASLELVSCTGTSVIALIADNTTASGSRSYTLPSNLAAGQYRIKAYRTGTGTPVAYGTCFSVGAAPSISVTAPLSGTFTPGQSITVSWTSTNLGGNASLELVSCTGTSAIALIADNTTASGSRSYTLPSNLAAGQYRIKAYRTGTGTPVAYGTCFSVGAAPSISVTAPLSESTFTPGQSITVSWTSTNLGGNASLELVSCTGTSAIALIADNTSASGSRSYTLPSNLAAGQYRIKAYRTGTGTPVAYGTCFSVGAAPSISVTAPLSGTFTPGQSITVSWTSTNLGGNASLELVSCTGTSAIALIADNTTASGSRSYTLPSNLAAGQYRIKAYRTGTGTPVAYGTCFSVGAAASISVTAPLSGTFTPGQSITVSWTSTNLGGNASLELVSCTGTSAIALIADNTSASGSRSYTLPSNLAAGQYRIKAYRTGTGTPVAYGTCFSVGAAPNITVTAPLSGTFTSGQSITVSWTSTNLGGNASLELVSCTGTSAIALIADNTSASGSRSYTLPSNLAAGQYRIKAYRTGTGTPVAYGTCFSVGAAPSISVTAPLSGTFTPGQSITVSWTSTNLGGNASLELVSCTGTSAIALIADNTTASGSRSYTLPSNLAAGQYRIKAYRTGTGTPVAYGTCFSVGAAASISVTAPLSGTFTPGQSITVSWTSTNLGGNASLELVSCTGTSAIALIADNTTASGSRSYTLPSNLAAGQYRIKAYRTGTGTPVAYGTCFSVGAAASISVTAPLSGTFTPGQSITVSWTSTNLGGNASLELVSCTGTSAIALIADNTTASGSRSYTLPSNLAAGQYRIKAYRTGTGTPVAYGTCFSVGAAASISVTAPLSGTFTPGQSITVSWTSTNLGGNASLELVSCTGTSAIALIADNTSASGSRSYTLPSNLAAGQYRIKAYRTGTGTPVAYGTCFSVGAAASISVTAPLSGTFTPGQSITVSWTSTNLGGNASLELVSCTGTSAIALIADNTSASGSRSYTLPSNLAAGQYRIKAYRTGTGTPVAYGTCFSVGAAASISVTAPLSGTFTPGQSITVSWTSTNLGGNASLELVSCTGTSAIALIADNTSASGSRSYTLPSNLAAGQYRIKAYRTGTGTPVAYGTCFSVGAAPRISVTAPLSGAFTPGQTITVSWTSTNLGGNASLELVSCTGTSAIALIADNTSASGSRSYTLPSNLAAGQYRIKAYRTGTGTPVAYGTCFSVTQSTSIKVISPISGSFKTGQTITVSWTSTNLGGNASIELVTCTGTSAIKVIADNTSAVGSKSFTLPSTLSSGQYRIKAYKTGTGNPIAYGGCFSVTKVSFTETEEEPAALISVFPNPSDGYLNIGNLKEPGMIYVVNLQGQLQQARNVFPPLETVNLTHLPKGMYILKFVGEKQIQTLKFEILQD